MIDIENKVIDTIQNAFIEAGKSVDVLGEYVLQPESFPCCMVRLISHSTYTRSMDGALMPHHASMAFQIDIFSNKEVGAKSEVKKLSEIAMEAMCSMKFVLDSFNVITNEDRTVSRATSRYSAIVQEGVSKDGNIVHQIYRR